MVCEIHGSAGGQGISFSQFTNIVKTKLDGLNMSEGKQNYVQSQLGSIFTQGDTNKDNQLSRTELSSVLGMLNQVVSLAQETDLDSPQKEQKKIQDPSFQGLEDYQFELHPAKDGFGAITVNGEKMLVEVSKEGKYILHRWNIENGQKTNIDMLEYSSMKELTNALTDKNNNFGTYSGLKDINDVFIP